MVRRSLPFALAAAALAASSAAAADKDVNVVNTPGVTVMNTPGVSVMNTPGVSVMNVPGVSVMNTPMVQLSPGGSVAATQAGSWSVSVLPAQPAARGTLTLGASTSSPIGPAPISTVSLALTNTVSGATGGGAGAGKVSFHELVVTRTLDASSTQLFAAAAEGRAFPTASVVMTDGAGNVLVRYDLQDVFVTSFTSGSDGSAQPLETVGLTFAKILIQTGGAGGATVGWDVAQNLRIQ